MWKSLRLGVAALCFLSVPVLASAADRAYVDLFGGNTFLDSGSGLGGNDHAPVVGLRVGQRVDAHLGIEAQIASAFAQLQKPAGQSAKQYTGAVIGNLYALNGPNTPYLSLGIGASSNVFGTQAGRVTNPVAIFGVGYQHLLGDHFGLRLDVQDQMLFDNPMPHNGLLNDLQVTGGISYFWGGSSRHRAFPIIGPAKP
ncbi:MAG: outer membrane beta-barrel protein [Acidithiobacillus sp.]